MENYYYPNNYIFFTHGRRNHPIADRFIPGGFILPFALGFATAPLIFNSNKQAYNPYPYQNYQYNYYPNFYPY